MFVLILIVIAAVVVYAIAKSEENWSGGGKTVRSNTVPAEVPGIMSFLHSFYALCEKHRIASTDVRISCEVDKDGCDIIAYTRIIKIDGKDAAEVVDDLKKDILAAKQDIENGNKDADSMERYKLKQKVADQKILDFFGLDQMDGVFWDIVDCEYVEGRYLEFETKGRVYRAFNQSEEKTLDSISAKVAESYPNFCVNRNGRSIIVSFEQ